MNGQWRIRHEGSPTVSEPMTDREVLEGLQEGFWGPTDEVQGPGETTWQPLEQHPHFAEALVDFEEELPPERPDETRLDMNPLIDVALVLLIFFILTTTYQSLRRVIDVPTQPHQEETGKAALKQVEIEEIREKVIIVEARVEDERLVVKVENEPVAVADLEDELTRWVNRTGKNTMLLDAVGIKWGDYVKILDAAEGARIISTLQRYRPPSPPAE